MTPNDGRLLYMPADTVTLTDRQARAHDAVKAAGYDGLTSAQLGAVVHPHEDSERCEFCVTAGNELGRALRAKGFFMAWTVVGGLVRPERDYDLPDGF